MDKDYQWDPEETWFETSPLDSETDDDGLLDGDNGNLSEDQYAEDKNNNGIVDDGETDPILKDSDQDDIDDGEELVLGTDRYTSNPTKQDTDSDGLPDGMETEGWPVGICYQATGEMKDEWDVTSDPNDRDTDNDGLTDLEEYINHSDPNNTDTDGDKINDYDEMFDNDEENTPIAYDGVAPAVEISIKVKDKGWGKYFMRIEARAKDLAGLDWMKIDVKGVRTKTFNLYGDKINTQVFSFEMEWGRTLGDGYTVYVKTADVNGNQGRGTKEVPRLMKVIKNCIMKMISMIKEAVEAFIEAVVEFFKWLANLLKEAILGIIRSMLKPIIDGIMNIKNNELIGIGSSSDTSSIMETKNKNDGMKFVNADVSSIMTSSIWIYNIALMSVSTFAMPFKASGLIDWDDVTNIMVDEVENKEKKKNRGLEKNKPENINDIIKENKYDLNQCLIAASVLDIGFLLMALGLATSAALIGIAIFIAGVIIVLLACIYIIYVLIVDNV